MYTALSWLFLGGIGLVIVWQNGGFNKIIARFSPQSPQTSRIEPPEKTTSKKKAKGLLAKHVNSNVSGTSTTTSSTETQVSKKRKIASNPVNGTVTAFTQKGQAVTLPRDENGDISDRDMARQLAQAQKGAELSSSNKAGVPKRGVKGIAADVDSSELTTETSSTGRDGDDDLSSPMESPTLHPISTAATSRAEDIISDMLEKPAAGPKILNVTGNWETQKTKQKQKLASKQAEKVETKKQRQQRQKREQQAEAVKQSNEEHKRKGEQQMRAARIADGTSAQTKTNSFKAVGNAWAEKTQGQGGAVKSPPNYALQAPLDTFEPKAATEVTTSGAITAKPLSSITNQKTTATNANSLKAELGASKTGALAASSRENAAPPDSSNQSTTSWADEVLWTEEEQIKKFKEQEDNWETVGSRKDKKKSKKENDTSSDASAPTTRVDATANRVNGANGQAKKRAINDSSQMKSKAPTVNANRFQAMGMEETIGGQQDDEWAA